MPENRQFIQQRLDSLNQIDTNIVALLANMSEIFDSYSTPSNNSDEGKRVIEQKTKTIYQTLSDIAIKLRKEVKIMDDNIGVFDKNDENVMILPIPVQQKNTQLGARRIKEEITQLNKLIPEEPNEDQKFKPKVKEEPVSVQVEETAEKKENLQENRKEEEGDIEMLDTTQDKPLSETTHQFPTETTDPLEIDDDDDFEMVG